MDLLFSHYFFILIVIYTIIVLGLGIRALFGLFCAVNRDKFIILLNLAGLTSLLIFMVGEISREMEITQNTGKKQKLSF